MKKAGDWQHRASKRLKELASGKYLSREAISEVESGAAGRVHTTEFRAWLVEEISRKEYSTARLPKTRMAEWDIAPQNREATLRRKTDSARGDVERKVRRWVHRQTNGVVGIPHLTAPMVARMLHSTASKGPSVAEVLATVVILAAANEITVNWRIQGRGGGKRDAMQEARMTMTEQWGMEESAVQELMNNAQCNITEVQEGTMVAVDFGSGYEGMKEGISRVMTVYGVDRERRHLGRTKGWTVPDLTNDFTKGGGDLVGKVLQEGQIREKECVYCHFSPSCTEESKLRFMETANGRDKGERSADQAKSIEEVVAGIQAHSARVPGWTWTIEQPEGSRT